MMTRLNWIDFKDFLDNRNATLHEFATTRYYKLVGIDSGLETSCRLKRNGGADVLEYEADYQTLANHTLSDSSGRPVILPAIAPEGWTFQQLNIELTTATLNSINANDYTGSAISGFSISFKDVSGNVLALDQAVLDASCTQTIVDIEPTFDFMLISGAVIQQTIPATDLLLYVVAVPDIPAGSGGSKEMVVNMNLKNLADHQTHCVDGRSGKRLNYSASFHTNKMRVILKHGILVKHKMTFSLEFYKL